LSNEHGKLYTSDYVFNETVTLTRKRTGRFEYAKRVSDRILGKKEFSDVIEVLNVGDERFKLSVEAFQRYDDPRFEFY
jgi:hypothetical protein